MTEIKSTDKQTAQINTDAIPPITSRFPIPDRVSIYGNSPNTSDAGPSLFVVGSQSYLYIAQLGVSSCYR